MLKLYALKDTDVEESYEEIYESQFLIDGYSFGDRLLEGIMFEVVFKDKTIISINCVKEHMNRFNDLNMERWLGEGKKYVQRMLNNGGDEVEISRELMRKYHAVGAGICDETEIDD